MVIVVPSASILPPGSTMFWVWIDEMIRAGSSPSWLIRTLSNSTKMRCSSTPKSSIFRTSGTLA